MENKRERRRKEEEGEEKGEGSDIGGVGGRREIASPLSLLADALEHWVERNSRVIGGHWTKRLYKESRKLDKIARDKDTTEGYAAGVALWAYALIARFIPVRHFTDHRGGGGRLKIAYEEEQIAERGLDVDSTKDLIRAIEINLAPFTYDDTVNNF
ncbi:MAG: hypothetical protein QXF17_06055 [Ignisphaera sp.]